VERRRYLHLCVQDPPAFFFFLLSHRGKLWLPSFRANVNHEREQRGRRENRGSPHAALPQRFQIIPPK